MLVKFLDHGTGSAKKAAAYLTGARDHNGEIRPLVKVLRGDPNMVAQIADSLVFKNRYTSGVFAFAPEDKPTDEQINALLDDFEKLSTAGLSADRISYSAILHGENDGGCHIHIFAARVDLVTGKSLNVAPPGWEKSYGALKDFYNLKNDWADPDDPARKRNLQPGKLALIEAAALRKGLVIEPDSKRLITEYIEQRITAGLVKNRMDVISALQDVGLEVTRNGSDYIGVKFNETGQRIRLKGAIYEQSFDITRPTEIADTSRKVSSPGAKRRSIEDARRDFDSAINRLAEYNANRYKKTEPSLRRERSDRVQPGAKADYQDRLVDAYTCGGYRVDLRADVEPDMAIPSHRVFSSENQSVEDDRRKHRDRIAQLERDEMRRRKHLLRGLQKMIEGGILIQDANAIYWNIDNNKIRAIIDLGDEIQMANKVTDASVRLFVATAINKGWAGLNLFGDKEFQLKAAKEALRNGMKEVSGTLLTMKDLEKINKELDYENNGNKRSANFNGSAPNINGMQGLHKLNSVYNKSRPDKNILRKYEPDSVRLQRERGRHDSQLLQKRNRRRGLLNDRAGDVTVGSIDEIERRGEESRKRFDDATRKNQQILADVEKSSRSLDDASRRVAESSELVGQRNREEIHAFKTMLSIAQVAEGHGYVLDPKSTPALTIMRSGNDQIMIKRGADGVETFARSGAGQGQGQGQVPGAGTTAGQGAGQGGGTIIDFIQQHENLNIGQVRRRLRPLLHEPARFDLEAELAKIKQKDETALRVVAKLQSTASAYQRAMQAIKDGEQSELPKAKT